MVHDLIPIIILPANKHSLLLTKLFKLKIRYMHRKRSPGPANIGYLTMSISSQCNDGFTLNIKELILGGGGHWDGCWIAL